MFEMDSEYKDMKSDSGCDPEKESVIQEDIDDYVDTSGDEPDKPPDLRVTNWDVCVLLVSIFSYIFDVALDINLAYRYFMHQQHVYFYLTLVFILFPAFVNTGLSIKLAMRDPDEISSSKMAFNKWTFRVIVLCFQLAPIMRYCDSLDCALKSRRAEQLKDRTSQRKYYDLMLKEDSDVALLRVFECFLEAAPQQILQVAIVLVDRGKGSTFQLVHQFGSICSSLLSMAWSMASYQRSIRFAQEEKRNLTWPGTAMQFLWHFMVTVSRILSISAVASAFPVYTGCACAVHWMLMTMWLSIWDRSQISLFTTYSPSDRISLSQRLSQLTLCAVLGLVYIFTYLCMSDGSTRNRYLVYYPVCFVENAAAILIWSLTADEHLRSSWYFIPFIISGIVPFLVGIVFMIIYYKYFHPETSRKIGTTVSSNYMTTCSKAASSDPRATTTSIAVQTVADPLDSITPVL
ncbi:XK-related protein 6 [Nilaparvata lugens]|uniref:XK-related protein 6 n=1 Tax=Nilaparvata lugens TaxID=108931 RepID=UPI00193D8661|nr:XK-related protein 6 [Nilaparvata lugens]